MIREELEDALLGLVSPQQARSYAHANGWQRVSDVNGGIALFSRPEEEKRFDQLVIPLDATFDDYKRRMADVVLRLAELEKRAPAEVLGDLLMPDADVIRYRVISDEAASGSLPLGDGIRLLDGARRAILAAGCSVIAPTDYHPRMSRTEAVQLADSCRLGQTERGSYTVTVACPLRAVDDGQQSLPDRGPFTRQATELLMESAQRLVSAIEQDDVDRVLEDEEDEPRISANYCDALLRMQPARDRSSLDISISWASTLPNRRSRPIPRKVRFQYDYFPIIEDVYRKLRPTNEPKLLSFVGSVDALNGDVGEDGKVQGEAVLLLLHDDELVKAKVELDPADYQIAVDAHRYAKHIAFRGVLHLGRRIHKVTELDEFRLVPEH